MMNKCVSYMQLIIMHECAHVCICESGHIMVVIKCNRIKVLDYRIGKHKFENVVKKIYLK